MADTFPTVQFIPQPFANGGDRETIANSPSSTEQQKANFQTGFPPITQVPKELGGIPPDRTGFNGIFYTTSGHLYNLQLGKLYTFNQDLSTAIGGYPLGSILSYINTNGSIEYLQSTKNNNTDNFLTDPSVIGTSWVNLLKVDGDYANIDLSNLSTTGQAKFDAKVSKDGLGELTPEQAHQLVGNRVWLSDPYDITSGGLLSVTHNLSISDPLMADVDILLFTKVSINGYEPGDQVMSWTFASQTNLPAGWQSRVTTNTVQVVVGGFSTVLYGTRQSDGVSSNMTRENCEVRFRIRY